MDNERKQLVIGYIPLTDCLPLLVAQDKGFFAGQGLDVKLSCESSWASIRDKLVIGQLDAAQMLAPMLVASTLGLGGIKKTLVSAFVMNLNGNAITVSDALYRQMQGRSGADALMQEILRRKREGLEPPVFAVVFPYSSHNYMLRDWMCHGGIDPDRDIKIVVLPPSQMVENLQQQHIDGFCVGEPWNSVAISRGIGHCVGTSTTLWGQQIEKVLAVTEAWAESHPDEHAALLRALDQSCRWLDEHRDEAVDILQQGAMLPMNKEVLKAALTGSWHCSADDSEQTLSDFVIFSNYQANRPGPERVTFLLKHMNLPEEERKIAAGCFRLDIYQQLQKALTGRMK